MNILRFIPLIVLFGLGITYTNITAEAIHVPLLVSMIIGVIIGILAPEKGWLVAIMVVVVIGIGYGSISLGFPSLIANQGIAQFTSLFSILTIFSGSFIGSFIWKTLKQ